MKLTSRLRSTVLGSTLAVALTLSGCASLKPKSPEEQVTELAGKRWAALIAGKWDDAYGMLAPSFRAVTPMATYRGKFGPGGWTGAEVFKVTCETEGACTARVIVTVHIPAITRNNKGLSAPVDETWVQEEGRWWFLDK